MDTPDNTQKPNALIYYRCRDCLTTFTSTEQPTVCACEGSIERLGRVTYDKKRYEETKVKSVCDARCTNASGPLCNCHCNCANHGTKRVIEVIVREGKVYVKSIDDKALNQCFEFRGLKAELEDLIQTYNGKELNWYRRHLLGKAYVHDSRIKVHKTRITRLNLLKADIEAKLEILNKPVCPEDIPF